MIRSISFLTFGTFILFTPILSNGQVPLLNRKDSIEIINRSEGLIKEFTNTLFYISGGNAESDIIQAAKMTYDSTAGTKQLFSNEKCIIENDLKPENYKRKYKTNIDIPVENYLNEFWKKFINKQIKIAYTSSIICDTFHTVSSDTLNIIDTTFYATVYFNSVFNVDDQNDWQLAKKKAEILCKKNSGKWDIKISEIDFSNKISYDSVSIHFKRTLKEKKFDRGSIPDSIPLYFCNYKVFSGAAALDSAQRSNLNLDLITAENFYSSLHFSDALKLYRRIYERTGGNDFLSKRISNCSVLEFQQSEKQKDYIEPYLVKYHGFYDRRKLRDAKNILDSALNKYPDNLDLKTFNRKITELIGEVSRLRQVLKTDPNKFKSDIDIMLAGVDSSEASYYFLRAIYYESKDINDKAVNDLSKAISIEPNFIDARKLRIEIYSKVTVGMPDRALGDLDFLISEEPENDTLQWQLGLCRHQGKLYAEAISAYSKAISISNKNPEYYFYRSLSYYELKEFDKSLADLNKSVATGTKNPEVYYKLFTIHYDRDNIDSSIINIIKAKTNGLSPEYKPGLTEKSDKHLSNGKSLLEQKENLKALKQFKLAAYLNYENYEAWYSYAKLIVDDFKEYKTAISALDSALKYNQANSGYSLLRGQAKLLDKQFDNALIDFSDVVNNPASSILAKSKASEGKGDAFVSLKKEHQAEDSYKESLQLHETPLTHFKFAKLLESFENEESYKSAIKHHNKIIDSQPNLDSNYYNRAGCYERMKENSSAIKDYKRTLEKTPSYPNANYKLGLCLEKEKDFEEAIECFEKEIKNNNSSRMLSYTEKGDCEFKLKKYDEACSTFRNADLLEKNFIKKDKFSCEDYIYSCIYTSYIERRPNQAELDDYLKYCISTYPEQKNFIYLEAEYLFISGKKEEARQKFIEVFKNKFISAEKNKHDEVFNRIKDNDAEIRNAWKDYSK
jgi:tetratricopeptide (TPR) repeat protein